MLTEEDVRKVSLALNTRIPTEICRVIFSLPNLRTSIKYTMMKEIDDQCNKLCVRKPHDDGRQPSVLHVKRKDTKQQLQEFTWTKILEEMKQRARDVLYLLCAISVPKLKATDKQVAPLCVAYGILLNNRWKELSLIQKVITTLFGMGHCLEKINDKILTAMHGFVLIGFLLSYTLCSHEKVNFDLGNIRTKSLTTAKKSTLNQ